MNGYHNKIRNALLIIFPMIGLIALYMIFLFDKLSDKPIGYALPLALCAFIGGALFYIRAVRNEHMVRVKAKRKIRDAKHKNRHR